MLWEVPGLWLQLEVASTRPSPCGLSVFTARSPLRRTLQPSEILSPPQHPNCHPASGLGEERGEDVAFHEKVWDRLWISAIYALKVLTHVVKHRLTHKVPVLAGSQSLLAQGPSLGLISAY